MTPAAFAAWCDARFRTQQEAADWFGQSQTSIALKRSGKRTVTELDIRRMKACKRKPVNSNQ
jgi:hypothetical protein